jgi:hypothetical protein
VGAAVGDAASAASGGGQGWRERIRRAEEGLMARRTGGWRRTSQRGGEQGAHAQRRRGRTIG